MRRILEVIRRKGFSASISEKTLDLFWEGAVGEDSVSEILVGGQISRGKKDWRWDHGSISCEGEKYDISRGEKKSSVEQKEIE